jgi:citrate synthase
MENNKVVIGDIEYVPKPPKPPDFKNGVVAAIFIEKSLTYLNQPMSEWTFDGIDFLYRGAAMKTAHTALIWYRDEMPKLEEQIKELKARIKELEEPDETD